MDDRRKAFWHKEETSLVVRKRALTQEDYVHPQLTEDTKKTDEFFETIQAPSLLRQQHLVYELLHKPMVNFQNLDNADIRLQFGTATLTAIEAYEENYTLYIKTLFVLGKGLYEAECFDEAKVYLEEGIHMGTDIKAHYMLLADLYLMNNDQNSLASLYEHAKDLQSLTKNALLSDLEKLMPGISD